MAAAEADARAQAAETACQQADGLAERASQWTAAEARKTSQADKDRWSSFARAAPALLPQAPRLGLRAEAPLFVPGQLWPP